MSPAYTIRIPRRAVFSAATVIFALCAGEVVQRISDWRKEARRAGTLREIYVMDGETTTGVPLADHPTPLRHRLAPCLVHKTRPGLTLEGTNAEGRPATLHVNAQGFRGTDWETVKRPGRARVVVLGGSAAFGHSATSDATTISGYLERALLARVPKGRDVEVWNGGQFGYDSEQELVLLATDVLDHAPDAVVLFDGWNDFFESGIEDMDREPTPLVFNEIDGELSKRGGLAWRVLELSALVRGLERKAGKLRAAAALAPEDRGRDLDRMTAGHEFREHPRLLARYRRNLARMCLVARAAGAAVVIAPQPELFARASPGGPGEREHCSRSYEAYARATYPRIVSAAADVAAAENAFFCDCTKAFDGTAEAVFVDPVHFNDRGNELVASQLAPVLARALRFEK